MRRNMAASRGEGEALGPSPCFSIRLNGYGAGGGALCWEKEIKNLSCNVKWFLGIILTTDMTNPITWDSFTWDDPLVTWDGVLPDALPEPVTPPLPACLTPIPMNLNTSIDFLKDRVDKTRSV